MACALGVNAQCVHVGFGRVHLCAPHQQHTPPRARVDLGIEGGKGGVSFEPDVLRKIVELIDSLEQSIKSDAVSV